MIRFFSYIFFFFLILITACTVTKPVKNGTMAYQVKQYAVAIDLLEEELRNENDDNVRMRKAHMLARSYDILQDFGNALKWFDIADQLANDINITIELAQSLKKNERYKEAEALFRDIYLRTRNARHLAEAEICRQANELGDDVDHVILTPFKSNTKDSEYSPAYFEDDFIVFSSDRDNTTGNATYDWTGSGYHDLFIVNNRGRIPQNFDAILNTEAHEGTACFSKDFNEIFFTRSVPIPQGGSYCRIFYSQRPNGFWMEPEPLLFFNDNTNFGSATLIENDSVLIFSASVNGASHDLYYSVRLSNGWSEAQIMPPNINTEGEENFPSAYGDTLFFSSDYHPGYGGFDIFRTHLLADGSWSTPVNMGKPINSGADDFGIAIKPDFISENDVVLQGLFSSSRNTGFKDDIFGFTIFERKEEEKETDDEPEIIASKGDYKIYLSARVVEIKYENDDPNADVIDRKVLENARIKLTSGDSDQEFFTNDRGRIITELDSGLNMTVLASKLEYLNASEDISTAFETPLRGDTTINVELALDKILYDKEIILNNIYYDFEKWDIREDARPTLDSLSKLLKINPQITIQLSSHTDCRGDDMFNEDLSQKRAQSAVNYLIDSGIEKERMLAKGYGESVPSIDCVCDECTEEEHQINRRSSFTILKDR